jgi:hypothetical protein
MNVKVISNIVRDLVIANYIKINKKKNTKYITQLKNNLLVSDKTRVLYN